MFFDLMQWHSVHNGFNHPTVSRSYNNIVGLQPQRYPLTLPNILQARKCCSIVLFVARLKMYLNWIRICKNIQKPRRFSKHITHASIELARVSSLYSLLPLRLGLIFSIRLIIVATIEYNVSLHHSVAVNSWQNSNFKFERSLIHMYLQLFEDLIS